MSFLLLIIMQHLIQMPYVLNLEVIPLFFLSMVFILYYSNLKLDKVIIYFFLENKKQTNSNIDV